MFLGSEIKSSSPLNSPNDGRFDSPEALREAEKSVVFDFQDMDPNMESVRDKVGGGEFKDRFFATIDRVHDIWGHAFEACRKGEQIFEKQIEMDGIVVDIKFTLTSPIFMTVGAVSSAWSKERLGWAGGIFGNRIINRNHITLSDQELADIASRLGVSPMSEFKAVQDFDPMTIDQGLDWRVMELIRLMNMMGIDSKYSCQGHRRGRGGSCFSYIKFGTKHIEKVLALLLEWRRFNGKSIFEIEFTGKYVTHVVMTQRRDLSLLRQAQRELDHMTDFLRAHLEHQRPYVPTLPEKIHRIRRKVLDLLPDPLSRSLVDRVVEEFEEGVGFCPPEAWSEQLRTKLKRVLAFIETK
jgi:hypothetical protein